MSISRKVLFLDTNYFLHYPPIQQTDWLTIANAKSVLICVSIQVIHELDSKKDDPRLKERARRAIKDLRDICLTRNAIGQDVTLQTLPEDIRAENFRPGLNSDNGDDRILQSVLNYKEAFPNEEVLVVSEDFGMEIKCANLNVTVLRPDEEKRLPDLEDLQSKKLRQTQQELDKHKNSLPKLRLHFGKGQEDSNSYYNINLPSFPEVVIEQEMIALQRKYPYRNNVEKGVAVIPTGIFGQSISNEEYQRYNKELSEFFNEYRKYYEHSEQLRQVKERSFKVSFTLENVGHCPAAQIDVHLHFPDGMNVFDVNRLPAPFKEHTPPVPPREPMRDIEKMFNLRNLDSFSGLSIPSSIANLNLHRDEPLVSPPKIVKSSSYDIDYKVKKLKHGYSLVLGELSVVFPSKKEAFSFAVDFILTADNHPESQSGELHFVTSRQKVP